MVYCNLKCFRSRFCDLLGACLSLRGHAATLASKKGSQKGIESVSKEVSQKGFRSCSGVGMLWTWEIAQKGKVSKALKKVFWTLLGPGSKGLPRIFCTTQTLFCTSAAPFRSSARGLLLVGSKRPFAPSPNNFREPSLFGQFPRSAASEVVLGF